MELQDKQLKIKETREFVEKEINMHQVDTERVMKTCNDFVMGLGKAFKFTNTFTEKDVKVTTSCDLDEEAEQLECFITVSETITPMTCTFKVVDNYKEFWFNLMDSLHFMEERLNEKYILEVYKNFWKELEQFNFNKKYLFFYYVFNVEDKIESIERDYEILEEKDLLDDAVLSKLPDILKRKYICEMDGEFEKFKMNLGSKYRIITLQRIHQNIDIMLPHKMIVKFAKDLEEMVECISSVHISVSNGIYELTINGKGLERNTITVDLEKDRPETLASEIYNIIKFSEQVPNLTRCCKDLISPKMKDTIKNIKALGINLGDIEYFSFLYDRAMGIYLEERQKINEKYRNYELDDELQKIVNEGEPEGFTSEFDEFW